MRRSQFDLSHYHLLTCDMGELVPVLCEEVLPGDTFIGSTSLLARVATMVNPTMHPVEIRVHHWYVPNRILWDNFDEFISGNDISPDTHPIVTPANAGETVLLDYMGVEPSVGVGVNALPVNAYNLIYNEFYRDQDLTTERALDALDIARCSWEKDYFTTCRAQPQQGAAVDIEFAGGTVPVASDAQPTVDAVGAYSTYAGEDRNFYLDTNVRFGAGTVANPLYADMSQATGGIDINDLRRSIALQRFAEARSRFGSRYVDYLRFLGINPSDGRLNRPEFLGGGKQTISFSEVLATAEGTSTNVGDMAGHGIAGMRSRRFRKMFEEHGWIISLLSARPKSVYLNGIPKKFLRTDPMDYWQRELEVLPWQEVNELEIKGDGDPANTFGWTPRYNEYRHSFSRVSGSFRSGPEIDYHLGREFSTPPALNGSFIECTPSDRIYADTSIPELQISAFNKIKARRLVSGSASIGKVGL